MGRFLLQDRTWSSWSRDACAKPIVWSLRGKVVEACLSTTCYGARLRFAQARFRPVPRNGGKPETLESVLDEIVATSIEFS